MLLNEINKLNIFFAKLAGILDIPEALYEDAIIKYETIGDFLAEITSPLAEYSPEIYPQGSFNLGTIIRPITDNDDFDIDLVCNLDLDKQQTTQSNLKNLVGDRLKEHQEYKKILEENRRCWRLKFENNYNEPNFHMDILPAIPNRDNLPTGILITDKELVRWQKSNPKAYGNWFRQTMKIAFDEELAFTAKSINATIEDVPIWHVKTPLQVVIQLLKRHRDILFQDDEENKPISIIITTLAALSYKNQRDIFQLLREITQEFPKHIENRGGQWWIPNPVDAQENFADKWNEYPERYEAFTKWMDKVIFDFNSINKIETFKLTYGLLRKFFGSRAIDTFAMDFNATTSPDFIPIIYKEKDVQVLGDTSHCQSLPWPYQERYTAKISGRVSHNKIRSKNNWPLSDRSVQKNLWIKFIVNTNTPSPYVIKWQIVNTGIEAKNANGLRGGFYDSEEYNNIRWESTSYLGTHWIEAFVIKDSICVAKTGRKLVKIR